MLSQWIVQELGHDAAEIGVASADASFRRYFRARLRDGRTFVVMDAPPALVDISPYLHVATLLQGAGVHVPAVHAIDRERGFVLLEDLGSTPFLTELRRPGRATALYAAALQTLQGIQVDGLPAARELPLYDAAALRRELELMPEWFCGRHLQLELDAAERELIEQVFLWLIDAALAQPVVFVHRDYHSRNLMLLPGDATGVIDFQDALAGPVGYDLVSLLKDCYIGWPRAQVESWVREYRVRLLRRGAVALCGRDDREFLRWFDLTGVQRHIKVLGIFARLWWRDRKIGYLDDLPLTLDYLRDSSARYPELREFARWLERRVVPQLAIANLRAKQAASK
ncbi:MAG: aminoglycoside phosphotransferase [Gammaproteobacteria bacterium]|nr:aminoglycoside phosphotransferase [Gammaproteobacteria bacterium]